MDAHTDLPDAWTDIFVAQAEFCRVMGHPVRVRILHHLHGAGGTLPSGELLRLLGVSKGALSQHLSRMAAAGLVRTRREGRYLLVDLPCEEIGLACDLVRAALTRQALESAGTGSDPARPVPSSSPAL